MKTNTLHLPPDRCAVDIGVSCELGDGAKAGDAAIWLLKHKTNCYMLFFKKYWVCCELGDRVKADDTGIWLLRNKISD